MRALCDIKTKLAEDLLELERIGYIYKLDARIRCREKLECIPAVKRGEMLVLDMSEGWMEILNQNVSKGSAIRRLAEYLGWHLEHTVCFGDSENDLSMFEVCGEKVAVGNALETVRKKADYVSPPADRKDSEIKGHWKECAG